MIPRANVVAWREHFPWELDEQVEQDLVLSRILVEIFSDPLLSKELAFRGGTALHKLFFNPPARYSEDIDLVRISTGPIGNIIHRIRNILDSWLGVPITKRNQGRFILYYRFEADTVSKSPLRVKIEINTRETDNVFPLVFKSFSVDNFWFNGKTDITTYKLEELLGTKLRAFFQRKKGRDLFDLGMAANYFSDLAFAKVIQSFEYYLGLQGLHVSRAEFESNLYTKLQDDMFLYDLKPLLPVNTIYNVKHAAAFVHKNFVQKLSGKAWKNAPQLIRLLSVNL